MQFWHDPCLDFAALLLLHLILSSDRHLRSAWLRFMATLIQTCTCSWTFLLRFLFRYLDCSEPEPEFYAQAPYLDCSGPVHAPGHVPDLAPARDLSDYRLCGRDDVAMTWLWAHLTWINFTLYQLTALIWLVMALKGQ
jgi:hypothetical protein